MFIEVPVTFNLTHRLENVINFSIFSLRFCVLFCPYVHICQPISEFMGSKVYHIWPCSDLELDPFTLNTYLLHRLPKLCHDP